MNHELTNELRFAHKVRQSLNESLSALPADRLERLAAARKAALRVQKPETRVRQVNRGVVLAGAGHAAGLHGNADFGRVGLVLALLLLVGSSLVGVYQVEQQKRIEELAEIDTAVLADEIPISAYADHGFNAFLKRNQ